MYIKFFKKNDRLNLTIYELKLISHNKPHTHTMMTQVAGQWRRLLMLRLSWAENQPHHGKWVSWEFLKDVRNIDTSYKTEIFKVQRNKVWIGMYILSLPNSSVNRAVSEREERVSTTIRMLANSHHDRVTILDL